MVHLADVCATPLPGNVMITNYRLIFIPHDMKAMKYIRESGIPLTLIRDMRKTDAVESDIGT